MIQINIKATNIALTNDIDEYVNKKLKPLNKFLRDENSLHVELAAESKHHTGPRFRAEITILPRPGIYADAAGEDLYEAIDLCLPKIKEQLLKKKDRTVSLRRRLGSKRKDIV